MKEIKYIYYWPLYLMILVNKKHIDKDISVWENKLNIKSVKGLLKYPEFRTLLYKRLSPQTIYKRLLCRFLAFFYKPQTALYIHTKSIGYGLFFEHGYSTIVSAESVGNCCHINQNVTIGWTNKGAPTIGDNVHIGTGAIIIGNINIGNNVIVGAGAVVTKSIPSDCVVVGNPARIIRKDGEKLNLFL